MAEAERATAGDAGDDAPAGAVPSAPKSRLRRLVPYAIAGLLSAGLGITAGIVTNPKHEEPVVEKPASPVTPYDTFGDPFDVKLPALVTNLADPNQSVSGKFTIHLELRLPKEAAEDARKKIEEDIANGARLVRIRDALLMLFTGKLSTDIKPAHGKEVLKLEILEHLAPIVFPDPAQGAITCVYFSEYVIQ
jgi:flagellar basal body-associated protein FliL